MLRCDRLARLAIGPTAAARLYAPSSEALLIVELPAFEGGARGCAACGRRSRFGPRTT